MTIVKTLPQFLSAPGAASRRAALACLGAWGAGLCLSASRGVALAAGELVRWPSVRLMDGRRWAPEAGRAQLLVFWSVSCPFCQRHNAHVQKLQDKVLAEGGLQILTVSRDRDPAAVARYLAAQRYSFAVTFEHEALRKALAARAVVPLTVLVDRRGRILQSIPGEMFEDDLMELQHLG